MPKEERKEKIDYSHGLYGAPVQICDPCINRERKRASRKKHKKPEEEEKWALDETKRIIVFNTNQVRQLERPQGAAAVYAETQMRICCYCRHHGEKEGFQVIFTVKDHLGAVVAQTISSTILITDDHKNTHATAAPMMHQDGAMASHPDQAPPGQAPPQVPGYPQGFVFHQPQPTHDVISNYSSPPASAFSTSPRIHHGSTPPSPMRTSSRSPGVHESKRRRGGKVPASLAMTPSEPSTHHRPQFDSTGINFSSRNAGAESRPPQWMAGNNGPVSPMALTNDNFFNDNGLMWGSGTDRNGFNNLLNSPPTSNIAPTVSTPMSGRQLSTTMQSPLQQQAALQLPDQQQQVQYTGPLVSRVVPSEGTCRGGIEITVLGQSFHNGLTVMFGDVSATDTFYFSDSTLLCRLPPNPNPGPVVVSLKNYPPFAQGPNVSIFTYVDDVEKELMALALTVVGMKMKGELGLGTHKQIALSILRENGIGTEAIERGRNNMGNQRGAELEQTLLTLLDVIDMDESPHPASLGHKNKSGQAMLHLASMLGMQKFVAALLARGVNANSRDKNGYTPLHFAVLFKRSDVIRRLVMNGANVGIRTRGGQTPTDLGESDQIAKATRGIQQAHSRQHSRSSSVSSEIRFSTSRSGSITSLAAGLPGMTRGSVDDYFAPNSEDDSSDLDYTSSDEEPAPWRSRKGSVQNAPSKTETSLSERGVRGDPFGKSEMASTVNATDSHLSPPAIMAAWMEAWREQLTQSFQNLQLSMPAMPTAQTDYQTLLREQMAKFQYQVPAMPAMPRWGGFGQQRGGPDYKWSELLHPPAAPSSPSDPAPPAYDELYPDGNAPSGEAPEKVQPMVQSSTAAATETSELRRRASPLPEPSSSKHALREIQRKITRRDHTPTEAEQAEYRAQIQKLQRIQNDRRLYFFWIPVLVFIMLAMAYTHGPRAWSITKQVVGFAKQVIQEPTVVRERVRMGLVQALGAPV
ncbi:hypothetical protein FN846DRAFT_773689 [Sphaerosporella brunnea]|uniref:IPT/TIG domain-containing protein n=1 Tax=Sphaerosporella brunnea TaxID=1250544 RepID=A0A5J5F607_9PEZI|nr:hypothetical protein FN846DRAFT_773689 [Sphaerosporella brunnea]